jgi:hypothetical protein
MDMGNLAPVIDSAASHARPSTQQERQAMLTLAARLDDARHKQDCTALMACFHPSAICEFKPAGLRLVERDTIAEIFKRAMPRLAASFAARRQLRAWTNQNGLLREWTYPVRLSSGDDAWTNQLEIIEFADGLGSIISYRVRMNALFSMLFIQSLGEDFLTLPGVRRVPG